MSSASIGHGCGCSEASASPASPLSKVLPLRKGEHSAIRTVGVALHKPRHGSNDLSGPIEAIDYNGTVAVVTLTSMPSAFWGLRGSSAFKSTLTDLAARPDVTSVVLHGDVVFGADFTDDSDAAAALVASVADCSVPVFAALEGDAIGLGLELALACSGRVAKEGSCFALPAVLGGRLPAAGGIQRLLVLTDVDTAARLIVFGETIDAAAALRSGLIDGMVARNLVKLAIALAHSHDRSVATSPPRLQPMSLELPSVRYQIGVRARGQTAPLAAVQAMEAAMRSPPRRSALEIQLIAARLSGTEQARALQHASASETALKRHREVQGLTLKDLALRLGWPMRREAIHLADEGAAPAQVDRSLTKYGFVQGPFHEADRLGFASVFSLDGREVAADHAWLAYSPTLDFMIEAGRAGGAQPGWFQREEGVALPFDRDVERIFIASALFQRLQRAHKSEEELERRLFHSMIWGSVDLLETFPTLTWRDVDALWTTHLGFPRWRGGPLFQGALSGWEKVRCGLDAGERRRTLGRPNDLLIRWESGEQSPPQIDAEAHASEAGSHFGARSAGAF